MSAENHFDGVPRVWRNRKVNLRMMAEVCQHCHKVIFPPRDICPEPDCGKPTGETIIYYSPVKSESKSSKLNGQKPV
jgi:uncharacterized OB-fold protein